MTLQVEVDTFESPKYLCQWTKAKAVDFEERSLRFIEHEKPYTWHKDIDSETGDSVLKIKLVKTPPWELRGIAADAVNHLRNALDQALFAAALELGMPAHKKKTHFPFARDPVDFDEILAGTSKSGAAQCRDVPAELHPVLRSFQPYPTGNGHTGGNDLLRKLGLISGPNKHQFTLTVAPDPASFHAMTIHGKGFQIVGLSEWDGLKDEIEFARVFPEGELEVDGDLAAFVAFRTPVELKGLSVSQSLFDLVEIVESIVSRLEAETAMILSVRQSKP